MYNGSVVFLLIQFMLTWQRVPEVVPFKGPMKNFHSGKPADKCMMVTTETGEDGKDRLGQRVNTTNFKTKCNVIG